MEYYDSMGEFLNAIAPLKPSFETFNAFVKAWNKIHGYGGGSK